MKKYLSIIIVLINITIVSGQKYGNVWQFGDSVGIDFNNCDPILISGNNIGDEGCSSIADSSGQLLFYTNSDSVWNSTHTLMSNGFLNSSHGTISQVIIIPKPLSNSIYYIITANVQGSFHASLTLPLQYHIVDMSANGGLGEVISKNNVISTLNVTEQIAATYHQNQIDIWILAHEYGTSNFLAFLVTSSGFSTTAINSNVGPSHTLCPLNCNARGEIKFSPDGKKIAFNGNGMTGYDSTNILSIFDFDNSTGQVSNAINLPFSKGEYGLSFSPDSKMLYGATAKAYNSPQIISSDYNYLYQFDLSSGDSFNIVNSKQIIDSLQVPKLYGSIKLAPDGKLYVRHSESLTQGSNYLGVINSPNNIGVLSNYEKNGFYIGNHNHTWQVGLNNYIEYTQYCIVTAISTLSNSENQIHIYPNPFSTQMTLQSEIPLKNATLLVNNMLGEQVKQIQNISGSKINFFRENLKSGHYHLILTDENNTISINKLVIID